MFGQYLTQRRFYYLDADLDEHDQVTDAVADVLQSKPIFTTTVLQMEVVHYLRNQLVDSDAPVQSVLSMEDATVAELFSTDVERAVEFLTAHQRAGIGGRDATVLAAMERHDVSRLWTHDEALKRMGERLDWLSVTDPVTDPA